MSSKLDATQTIIAVVVIAAILVCLYILNSDKAVAPVIEETPVEQTTTAPVVAVPETPVAPVTTETLQIKDPAPQS